ncbi:MFS transporter [Streptomyces endophyticus]|uniref:MFS transporter n=1 Tax=Streptomyces endophyticus TaxID=714166 RepID=A0ABU6F9J9_9ACTN|nr:MFS transporter [Streptomyces endophyticus]MEB8340292.1 MFS transporter [Streptomyces endophyticus]
MPAAHTVSELPDTHAGRAQETLVTDPKVTRRAVGAAAIGNITEWFDFGVFANLTPVLTAVFFTGASQTVGTIGTLGLFAVAFLVRPIGGMFFGPLGDRIGRTKVLSITVIMMAIGTFVIAFIPGYETWGPAAPLLMLLARLVQGFSTGGEYGGAMTFIAEYAPDKKRGFLGSWLEFGTLTGYLLGGVAGLVIQLPGVMSHEDLLSWGWRIPFLISGPIGIIGLYLRLKLEDTPAFKAAVAEQQGREGNQTLKEIRRVFTDHWRPMLICMGLVLVFNVTNYMLTTYMLEYIDKFAPSVSATWAQLLEISVLAIGMVLITFVGRLSDRIGRKPVLYFGCGALIVLGVPSVLLIQQNTLMSVFLGLGLMSLMLLCFNSTIPSTLPALFPTDIRYGGLSIAFNLSVSLFGGTTAVVNALLVQATGDVNVPGYYLMAAGAIGAVAAYFAAESAGRPLPGSAPAVEARA